MIRPTSGPSTPPPSVTTALRGAGTVGCGARSGDAFAASVRTSWSGVAPSRGTGVTGIAEAAGAPSAAVARTRTATREMKLPKGTGTPSVERGQERSPVRAPAMRADTSLWSAGAEAEEGVPGDRLGGIVARD